MQQVAYRIEPDARATVLRDCLAKYQRIAVSGGPRTGKSTFVAGVTDRLVVQTDDFSSVGWAAQPQAVIDAVRKFPRFVVEGVQVPRALRKGMQVDVLIWLTRAMAPRTAQQLGMEKGIITVFDSCRAELDIPIIVVP
jgi:hypothetical protein